MWLSQVHAGRPVGPSLTWIARTLPGFCPLSVLPWRSSEPLRAWRSVLSLLSGRGSSRMLPFCRLSRCLGCQCGFRPMWLLSLLDIRRRRALISEPGHLLDWGSFVWLPLSATMSVSSSSASLSAKAVARPSASATVLVGPKKFPVRRSSGSRMV